MNMSQYMSVFIDEAREHLQLLNDSLLNLEKNTDDLEMIGNMFRAAHTLKGMAATMGFTKTTELTHNMESILDQLRSNKIEITSAIVDLLFESLDILNLLIDEVIDNGEELKDISEIVSKLSLVTVKKVKKITESPKEGKLQIDFTEYEKELLEEASEKNQKIYIIEVILEEGCLLKAARTYMVFRNLEAIGEIIKSVPEAEILEEEEFDRSFLIAFSTEKEKGDILEDLIDISEVDDIIITELDVKATTKIKSRPLEIEEVIENILEEEEELKKEDIKEVKAFVKNIKNDASNPKPQRLKRISTVKVNTEKLDSLMNLVAELVINKTRLAQISTEYNLQALTETLSHVDRVTADLQAVVTKVRMVPIENVFNRFPRMVRDLSKELTKEIEFVIEGKETELDRTVIDEIGDPLVHLIRNSIDHGIEMPEEREKNGKSRIGTILLKAEHEGNNVVITITDDGKGLDCKKIAEKAVSEDLVSEEEIALMTDYEILQFIFQSGFSMAKEITDISGRGVGMDVVKNKIEGLNGRIELNTVLGKGTETRIKLPLTLAIIEALLVKLKHEIYAVPLANIVETIDILQTEIKEIQGEQVIVLRGEVVPIINLGELLEVPEYKKIGENNTVVIVKIGSKKIGLIVDFLIGQQEIVIKSLGKVFTGIQGITGATVLGNGEVALILDVLTLI